MDPFIKRKVKTVEEKNELLRQARIDFEKVGVFSFLVAPTWEEYAATIEASIEVQQPAFEAPRALTSAEITKQQTDLVHLQIFGSRRTDTSDLPPVLQKVADEQEAEDLTKLLGPARRQQSALDALIQDAVEKALRKTSGASDHRMAVMPKPIPKREGIMPLVRAAVEEDPGSDIARYLSAFVSGDEQAQRQIARELAAA